MLEYERIDISEGTDVNKTNLSKVCDICHYWYFKDIGFKYEPYPSNGCHGLMQEAMSFNNIAIVHLSVTRVICWGSLNLENLWFYIWVAIVWLFNFTTQINYFTPPLIFTYDHEHE